MRILWLKTELLHPVDKGGRIRTYQMLRALSRDHEITYLSLDDCTGPAEATTLAMEYCSELLTVPFHPPPPRSARFYSALARNLVSRLPYPIARYRSPAFSARLARLLAERDFEVVVCDFLFSTVNLVPLPSSPSVLFQHNVEAEIWRRRMEVANGGIRRAYFTSQWRRMEKFEAVACRQFDVIAAVSESDAAHFRDRYGVSDVVTIPTGVDTEYFRPDETFFREEKHIVFTGSMDWMPNQDGITFFVEQVMPRLRQRLGKVRLTVVGRSPTPHLLALAERDGDIVVTGRVPDVRPYLNRATAAVVPLRVGGGTRLKIYEAMAMECPVVSTTIGAEGLPLTPGEHLLIADDPEALSAACASMLLDRGRAKAIADRAAEHVRQQGWQAAALGLKSACERAIRRALHRKGERTVRRVNPSHP